MNDKISMLRNEVVSRVIELATHNKFISDSAGEHVNVHMKNRGYMLNCSLLPRGGRFGYIDLIRSHFDGGAHGLLTKKELSVGASYLLRMSSDDSVEMRKRKTHGSGILKVIEAIGEAVGKIGYNLDNPNSFSFDFNIVKFQEVPQVAKNIRVDHRMMLPEIFPVTSGKRSRYAKALKLMRARSKDIKGLAEAASSLIDPASTEQRIQETLKKVLALRVHEQSPRESDGNFIRRVLDEVIGVGIALGMVGPYDVNDYVKGHSGWNIPVMIGSNSMFSGLATERPAFSIVGRMVEDIVGGDTPAIAYDTTLPLENGLVDSTTHIWDGKALVASSNGIFQTGVLPTSRAIVDAAIIARDQFDSLSKREAEVLLSGKRTVDARFPFLDYLTRTRKMINIRLSSEYKPTIEFRDAVLNFWMASQPDRRLVEDWLEIKGTNEEAIESNRARKNIGGKLSDSVGGLAWTRQKVCEEFYTPLRQSRPVIVNKKMYNVGGGGTSTEKQFMFFGIDHFTRLSDKGVRTEFVGSYLGSNFIMELNSDHINDRSFVLTPENMDKRGSHAELSYVTVLPKNVGVRLYLGYDLDALVCYLGAPKELPIEEKRARFKKCIQAYYIDQFVKSPGSSDLRRTRIESPKRVKIFESQPIGNSTIPDGVDSGWLPDRALGSIVGLGYESNRTIDHFKENKLFIDTPASTIFGTPESPETVEIIPDRLVDLMMSELTLDNIQRSKADYVSVLLRFFNLPPIITGKMGVFSGDPLVSVMQMMQTYMTYPADYTKMAAFTNLYGKTVDFTASPSTVDHLDKELDKRRKEVLKQTRGIRFPVMKLLLDSFRRHDTTLRGYNHTMVENSMVDRTCRYRNNDGKVVFTRNEHAGRIFIRLKSI